MKVVIVGAVAGGASAAARIRRLSESAEVILLEKGHDPSFANCGMPYYIGGQIATRDKLLVAPKQRLVERYRLDVRTQTLVTKIDRPNKQVHVRNLEDGREYQESYDKLILSTGAAPLRPPLPGITLPSVHTLRDLSDADRLHQVAIGSAKRAVIIGGGFIGIELAENLIHRGLDVTLVELNPQILPPWDAEMISDVQRHLTSKGVRLRLGDSAVGFEQQQDSLHVSLASGDVLKADFAMLCIGVRPESGLAAEAGLSVAARGGIVTSANMQTSDPDIYAVGDAVEVKEFVSGQAVQIPLAGPANRQGRIAADHIFGRSASYRGTQGTAVVGVFDMTAAMTGLSEKVLQRFGIDYEKVYVHPSDHASYYPGATKMTLKLLFSPADGKILGAQACGGNGVDKRIDVLAMAIQAGMTVFDLEESELCYAPQYGSAKDPVNMAGFVAAGVLRGDQPIVHAGEVPSLIDQTQIVDVRTAAEFAGGSIPGAINIPLESLRQRIGELDRSAPGDRLLCGWSTRLHGDAFAVAKRLSSTQPQWRLHNLESGSLGGVARQELMQMKVKRPQLSAVVAC
ncbi:MAG: FAD-dependent oxidoreductase [Pirellulaceae bacterium]